MKSIAVATLALFAATPALAQQGVSPTEIVVGTAQDLSGPIVSLSKPAVNGMRMRLDEVNAQVAAAVNPDALMRQNEAMRLALAAPREIQVVRVSGSAELRLVEKRNRDIFRVETASFASFNRQPELRVVTASLQ